MEKSRKREIKRIRHVLDEIVSLAEDDELEGGVVNAVRRFNAIVRHLEGAEILPSGLFQLLAEQDGAVGFQQVAVECRMLSGYLEEVVDEEEESTGKPDFSPVIALAPFLDQSDLKALIQSHLSGRGFAEPRASDSTAQGRPSLQTLVGLAPHMPKKDLAEMVEACLAREPLTDPHLLVALAPHLDRQDLGRIMRRYAPAWFDPSGQGDASEAAAASATAPAEQRDSEPPTYDR
jgi:hypothetical protein